MAATGASRNWRDAAQFPESKDKPPASEPYCRTEFKLSDKSWIFGLNRNHMILMRSQPTVLFREDSAMTP
jgi:hypothetical protein